MSLRPQPLTPVPDETARVAHAAFPADNTYLALCDELGTLFTDDDFALLYPVPPRLPGGYAGEAKTRLQHVATAAAMNILRIGDWLAEKPREQTRTSAFARLMAPPTAA